MEAKICECCKTSYTPKPMGYNSKYCSNKCANKVRRGRRSTEIKQKARRRNYEKVRVDPLRRAKHLDNGSRSADKTRRWLADYKVERGCCDCGYKKCFAALQLDHMGTKSIEISKARSSISRLQAEIDKGECVVRCANCHAEKTWAEKQKSKRETEAAIQLTGLEYVCKGCQTRFTPSGFQQQYCTPECRRKAWLARRNEMQVYPGDKQPL